MNTEYKNYRQIQNDKYIHETIMYTINSEQFFHLHSGNTHLMLREAGTESKRW